MATVKQIQRQLKKQLERAASLAKSGQFSRAITRYQSLQKTLPENLDIQLQLAHAQGLAGQREAALETHAALLKAHPEAMELHVRMAREREEWQDFEGALAHWELVSKHSCQWQKHAQFHRLRLLERCNRLDEAQAAWESMGTVRETSWAWCWLEGRLAERSGEIPVARKAYQSALDKADAGHKANCASALARMADRLGDFEEAYRWIGELQKLRRVEAQRFQKLHPLSISVTPLPTLDDERCKPDLIFLTGFPRAGTTLMAHRLREFYDLALSEEYPFLRHLVDQQAKGSKLPSPQNLFAANCRLETVAAYWEAQNQSLSEFTKGEPLIDKNPGQASLTPWVLVLFPQAAIIWMDRDPRDLWLSSVMLDVPVNAVSCWWNEISEFDQWYRNQIQLRDQLEAALPEHQFQRVSYEDLVHELEGIVDRVGRSFGLATPGSAGQPSAMVTSPSYAEVIRPITTKRTERWTSYRELLGPKDLALFDQLVGLSST